MLKDLTHLEGTDLVRSRKRAGTGSRGSVWPLLSSYMSTCSIISMLVFLRKYLKAIRAFSEDSRYYDL